MAIELVSKIFGSGLQVDKIPPPPPPSPYSNVYLPQSGGKFPIYPPPFYGMKLLEWVKQKRREKNRLQKGKTQARDCCEEKTVHSAGSQYLEAFCK